MVFESTITRNMSLLRRQEPIERRGVTMDSCLRRNDNIRFSRRLRKADLGIPPRGIRQSRIPSGGFVRLIWTIPQQSYATPAPMCAPCSEDPPASCGAPRFCRSLTSFDVGLIGREAQSPINSVSSSILSAIRCSYSAGSKLPQSGRVSSPSRPHR